MHKYGPLSLASGRRGPLSSKGGLVKYVPFGKPEEEGLLVAVEVVDRAGDSGTFNNFFWRFVGVVLVSEFVEGLLHDAGGEGYGPWLAWYSLRRGA